MGSSVQRALRLLREEPSDHQGETSMGDYLCAQVKRFIGRSKAFKDKGRDNIPIEFAYSMCGGEWTTVKDKLDGGSPLATMEPLCCTPRGKFRRCANSPVDREVKNKC